MVRDPELTVRAAAFEDCAALGLLMRHGLDASPSADRDVVDVPEDVVVAGALLVDGAVERGEIVLVAEEDLGLVGVARVLPRLLVRARHVAELQVMVHPPGRREGAGRALVDEAVRRASARSDLQKLTMRVARDDRALLACVQSAGGWSLEREEHGALAREEEVVDVLVMTRWIGPPDDA